MLIENWAFLADTLSFKMDQIANEIFIDTVTEIENGFRLSKLTGFQPQPPIAARSMWTATINNPILTDIPVPAPLDIAVQSGTSSIFIELFPADQNNNPIFDQDIIIPAGSIVNASVVGVEGRTRTQEVTSDSGIGQTIQLTNFPVIWDSIRVDVDGVVGLKLNISRILSPAVSTGSSSTVPTRLMSFSATTVQDCSRRPDRKFS
jgi:hypothetical protein